MRETVPTSLRHNKYSLCVEVKLRFVNRDGRSYTPVMSNPANWTVLPVQSLEMPGLAPYRTLRRPLEHIRQHIFVAEGEKVVRRLLASQLEIVSLLLTEEWYGQLGQDGLPDRGGEGVSVYIAPRPLLESIVGFNLHQGIMAVAKVPKEPLIDEVVTKPPHLLVALDRLANAENVGIVVRNCVAFGVHGLIVGPASSSPYLRRAVRNSMGAVFQLPVIHVEDLPSALRQLRQDHGTTVVAADPNGSVPIARSRLMTNVCIVLGGEGEGISFPVLNVADVRVAIPMMNGTDSLNVANASAVFLYEVQRQRSGK